MKQLALTLTLIGLLVMGTVASALAGGMMSKQEAQAIVQPMYDLLSGKDAEAQMRANYSADWKSFYANGEQNFKTLDQTIGFVSGPLRQMVPDLKWEIKDILLADGGRVIVRGEGSGTPAGDNFMGQPAAPGKSFAIMAIDIHTVQNGKVVYTHHVENWSNAFAQIRPE